MNCLVQEPNYADPCVLYPSAASRDQKSAEDGDAENTYTAKASYREKSRGAETGDLCGKEEGAFLHTSTVKMLTA